MNTSGDTPFVILVAWGIIGALAIQAILSVCGTLYEQWRIRKIWRDDFRAQMDIRPKKKIEELDVYQRARRGEHL